MELHTRLAPPLRAPAIEEHMILGAGMVVGKDERIVAVENRKAKSSAAASPRCGRSCSCHSRGSARRRAGHLSDRGPRR
eukprot:9047588-Alexandrium_andersonii.AAC.1